MKIFLNNLPMGDVQRPERQPGEFFPRLVGIKVSIDGNFPNWPNFEPVYIPVLRFQRRAGQVHVEINWDRPLCYITLQRRKPYMHIFYFPWWIWDREKQQDPP